jgi:hypothetical protein
MLAATVAAAQLSNPGVPLRLSPAVQHALVVKHRSPHIAVLGKVGRQTFFRFGDSGRCFGAARDFRAAAVSPATVPNVFGGVLCSNAPSPTYDFSIWGASRANPTMHLERLAGVAADDVAAIELLAADGQVIGRVPVRRNLYGLLKVPPGVVRTHPAMR